MSLWSHTANISIAILVGRNTERPRETAGISRKTYEIERGNQDVDPAADIFQEHLMRGFDCGKTQIDQVHFVFNAPLETLNDRFNLGRKRTVKNLHRVHLYCRFL